MGITIVAHHKKSLHKKVQQLAKARPTRRQAAIMVAVAALGIVGSVFLLSSQAAGFVVSGEAEDGVLAGAAAEITDANASGGAAVKFAGGGTTPPPPVDKTPGARRPLPTPPTGCTKTAAGSAAKSAVSGAKGGDVICISGDVGDLDIGNSGSAGSLIKVLGDGNTKANSMGIDGDYIFVSGIDMINGPGGTLQVSGNYVTVEDVIVDSPGSGANGDAVRFWGSNLVFRHNTFKNTDNSNGHADAMQNYSTSTSFPRTNTILVEYNRMESIANICLIMEGPDSSYGDGDGQGDTYGVIFRGNYCDAGSAQGIWLDDVQDWTVEGSTFDNAGKGIGADNGSTGGTVTDDNVFNMSCKVGLSSDSKQGYTGPPSGCAP